MKSFCGTLQIATKYLPKVFDHIKCEHSQGQVPPPPSSHPFSLGDPLCANDIYEGPLTVENNIHIVENCRDFSSKDVFIYMC